MASWGVCRSKSPKSLSSLASTLALSSISRARTTGTNAIRYTIRLPDGRSTIVVTQARAASAAATSPVGSSSAPSGSARTTGSNPREGTALLRSSGTAASSTISSRTLHTSSRSAHQQPLAANSSSNGIVNPLIAHNACPSHADGPSYSGRSSPLSSSEGSLLLTPHPVSVGNAAAATPSDPSASSTTGTTSSSSNSKETTVDRATLFGSSASASYPSQALPTFFGASLNVARRSNLVFRNGAYGIPKIPVDDKGKEKAAAMAEAEETNNIDLPLSVSVGEDAYFLRADSLGVADGVGGWSRHAGANPARWSRKLMHHCSSELARYDNVDDELFLRYYEVDPVEVLQVAFEKSLSECKEEGIVGSSTALLAVLRNDELRLANMGDCTCSVIRGNDYIFRSEEQQHAFNYPVQIGTNSKDTPTKNAQRFNIKVQKDDIVILSSDGLLDNIFDYDLLEEVNRFVAASRGGSSSSRHPSQRFTLNRFSPQAVSEALSRRAQSVYEDPHAVASPFQQRAVEEGIYFTGGKRDDITTVVAVVGELEPSADRR
ncbi:hypothetical protein OIV83_000866 [Microbotryomycetes sp. JL201]|nr:hypothetical protein OIV83_000866 [Microbotryomycetes sp. JL201]